ncbi:MAG TPA: DUF3387 domain-containing protein, partial [Microthrixaceae bacterium]|nr:DUF3387 domain-containing protein [Microthrixaceae bacterium]
PLARSDASTGALGQQRWGEQWVRLRGELGLGRSLRLFGQMDVLHGMLHGVDYGEFRSRAWQLLPAVANHILALDDGKQRFADAVLAVVSAPKGTRYALLEVQPEAPIGDPAVLRAPSPDDQGEP